jgi:hypothetical protein
VAYKDPEKRRAAGRRHSRAFRQRNPEKTRASDRENYERHRDSKLANMRSYRERGLKRVSTRRSAHAMQPEDWAESWVSQDGRCYLCREPFSSNPRQVQVDHDHSHCPQGQSCRICRRGLACGRCNLLIGQLNDSPALLRSIADALEAANLAVAQRKATAHIQDALFPEIERTA